MGIALFLTLLHSLWQSAVLLFSFFIFQKLFSHQSAATKRDTLFYLVVFQIAISLFTFLNIYFGYTEMTSVLLPQFIRQYGNDAGNIFRNYTNYFVFLYIILFFGKSANTIFQWFAFRKNISAAISKADVSLRLFAAGKATELGIKREIRIGISNNITSPMTYGFLKPIILLPFSLISGLSAAETEAIIIHELSHIRNNDYLKNWIVIAAEHIYFFNPFLLKLTRDMRLESEIDCDMTVLQFQYEPLMYASLLLQTAKTQQQTPSFTSGLVTPQMPLLERIRRFTGNERTDKYYRNYPVIFAPVISCFFIATILTTSFTNTNTITFKKNKLTTTFTETPKLIWEKETINAIAKPATETVKKTDRPKIKTNTVHEPPIVALTDIHQNTTEQTGVHFASFQEPTEQEKQILVKEEDPVTGNIITSAYRLILKEGKWTTQLQWMIEEKHAAKSEQ